MSEQFYKISHDVTEIRLLQNVFLLKWPHYKMTGLPPGVLRTCNKMFWYKMPMAETLCVHSRALTITGLQIERHHPLPGTLKINYVPDLYWPHGHPFCSGYSTSAIISLEYDPAGKRQLQQPRMGRETYWCPLKLIHFACGILNHHGTPICKSQYLSQDCWPSPL